MRVGVIGGTGLYDLAGLTDARDVVVDTPLGAPSSPIRLGRVRGVEVAFLARHGRDHSLLPSEVPYRANALAFKKLGVERIIAVSAVGSLRAEIAPGDVVVVDQFLDQTTDRVNTFFGRGVVAHVEFAEPADADLRRVLVAAVRRVGAPVHDGGTYVCIDGPMFATRAESRLYGRWGADIIGMTNLPEARLMREAGLSIATLAMVTDYDSWREDLAGVTADAIFQVLRANAERARDIVGHAVEGAAALGPSRWKNVLANALVTPLDQVPAEHRPWLDLLLGKT